MVLTNRDYVPAGTILRCIRGHGMHIAAGSHFTVTVTHDSNEELFNYLQCHENGFMYSGWFKNRFEIVGDIPEVIPIDDTEVKELWY